MKTISEDVLGSPESDYSFFREENFPRCTHWTLNSARLGDAATPGMEEAGKGEGVAIAV